MVNDTSVKQIDDDVHDRRDRLHRAEIIMGRYDPQRCHVGPEQLGLAIGDHSPVLPEGHRPLEERIVDIGHVLGVVNCVTGITPHALQNVECEVGEGMAEVGGVIGGDAADVHPRGLSWRCRTDLSCRRVIQTQRSSDPRQVGDVWVGPCLHEASLAMHEFSPAEQSMRVTVTSVARATRVRHLEAQGRPGGRSTPGPAR